MVNKFIKLTLLLVSICVLSAARVFADSVPTETINFTFRPPTTSNPLPATLTFMQDGLSFTATAHSSPGTDTGLWGVPLGLGTQGGGVENSIRGTAFIQLDITALVAAGATDMSISVRRAGNPGNWNVLGSTTKGDPGTRFFTTGPLATPMCATGNCVTPGPSVSQALPTSGMFNFRNFPFISVIAEGGGVFLDDLSVTVPTTSVPTTEPSSAGLLLIGLGALVVVGTLGKKLLA